MNRLQVKRVLYEPVVVTFPQAVRKRTKRPKNAQVKIGTRAYIEPDVGERVHIEPPVKVGVEWTAGKAKTCKGS